MVSLQLPAKALSGLLLIVVSIFSRPDTFLYRPILDIALVFSITLQWLFIGWLAKTIALDIEAWKS